MKKITLIITLFCWFTASAQISPYLKNKIDKNPDATLPVIIILKDQWNADSAHRVMNAQKLKASERVKQTVKNVKAFTQKHQKPILKDIANIKNQYEIKNTHPFWAANIISMNASAEAIYELSAHNDVARIVYDQPGYAIYPGEKNTKPQNIKSQNTPGPGVINAPALWAMGYTGKGTIAMGIDTGVFPNHPAFENRFLGNYLPISQCWFGYNNNWPFDISDHGTHTMGTTLGMVDDYLDTIGVAYNAYFIASDPIVSDLSELRPRSQIMEAFQWALNPDGNENTVDDVPDAINNSWGLSNADNPDHCDMPSTLVLNTVHTAGIAVIFSAGNDGPSGATIGEPAHITRSTTNVFSVGAVAPSTLNIAGFSSRGPTNCYDGGDTTLLIKPEVSAPGVGINSSTGTDGYGSMSGTSMAAPHVTGAVLLLKEAFPEVSGNEILMALYHTATDLGEPGEDNTYGNGLINAEAAYHYLAETYTPIEPDSVATDPFVSINQKQLSGPSDRYEFQLKILNADSIPFNITEISIFDDAVPTDFDSTVIDSGYAKFVNISINANDLQVTNKVTHPVTGKIYTDVPGDDSINNQFWLNIYHPEVKEIPYTETFEEANHNFTNSSVFAENPDQYITWKADTIDGFENNKRAAKMLFVKYKFMEEARDYLHFPPVNIAGSSTPQFSFKYCYALRTYSIFEDTLLIRAKYGNNFEQFDTLFFDYGESLATMDGNYNTFNFVPTSYQQWKDTTISLTHLQNYDTIQLEFVAINDNGNNLFVDNIAIHEGENPLRNFKVKATHRTKLKIFPNPAKSELFVKYPKGGILRIVNLDGKTVKNQVLPQKKGTVKINIANLKSGVYIIHYSGAHHTEQTKLIKY